jgi:hypothetical protein
MARQKVLYYPYFPHLNSNSFSLMTLLILLLKGCQFRSLGTVLEVLVFLKEGVTFLTIEQLLGCHILEERLAYALIDQSKVFVVIIVSKIQVCQPWMENYRIACSQVNLLHCQN